MIVHMLTQVRSNIQPPIVPHTSVTIKQAATNVCQQSPKRTYSLRHPHRNHAGAKEAAGGVRFPVLSSGGDNTDDIIPNRRVRFPPPRERP